MKQIVDKLNKIAKKIDESVEIPQTDLIIDSLDAITKAYGGTPNDSNLIVDKLEDIAGVAHSGITPSGNIEITENTAEGEPLDVSQYATATVNVAGGGEIPFFELTVVNNSDSICYPRIDFTQWLPDYNGYWLYGPDIGTSESLTIENLLYAVNVQSEQCFINTVFDHESISELTYAASNLVNCTFNNTEFIITDPTLPASATLTISSGGVG